MENDEESGSKNRHCHKGTFICLTFEECCGWDVFPKKRKIVYSASMHQYFSSVDAIRKRLIYLNRLDWEYPNIVLPVILNRRWSET